MQNTSPRPDPSTLPVLTDVVELPFEPAPAAAANPVVSVPVVAEAPVAELNPETADETATSVLNAPSHFDDSALEGIRLALLEDLKARIDPWLEQRVHEHLKQGIDELTHSLTHTLHHELDQLLDEALNKELIQREALRAQEKLREKLELDDPATT